ncbi:hypothetical protein GPECTOR_746g910 [Gonium pectorale]|uniref:Uncharacterized protein n=1 Tax=Gonium pectorale TaxID=33097 RepID=A0A150FU42_GONPE|nr:hypothetical protein GPECTOR_746g910 [Gonium pectorale]|eukprot:KXZ41129.1 hypothetical protein GPECTOR_746g910 [Gonium pectorale]
MAEQLAAATARAEEAHGLAADALAAAGPSGAGGGESARADSEDSGAAAAAEQKQRLEELDSRVSAATEQSGAASAEVRSLAAKLAELEAQAAAAAATAGAASAKAEAAAAAAAEAAGGGAGCQAAERLVGELESRLTAELGEALKELIGQANDLEALRLRVHQLEAGGGGGGAGAAAAADKPKVEGGKEYVTTAEMQEVLDVVASKMDAQSRGLKAVQRVADGLVADLQEAAHDVGQMTVAIKAIQDRLDALSTRVETAAAEAEARRRGAAMAPGNVAGSAVAAARAGRPSLGVVPPGGVAGGPPSWEAVLAADEAARVRDVELDEGIHQVALHSCPFPPS